MCGYFDNSLKGQRPEKSVLVAETRDSASPLPENRQQFLRVNSNNVEMFKLLKDEVMKTASAEQVFVVTA